MKLGTLGGDSCRISFRLGPNSVLQSSAINDCCVIHVMYWIGLSSVLRSCQHSIGYMGDGFYRSIIEKNFSLSHC